MRLPRDLDAPMLIKALARLGYESVRQSGSHIRLHCKTPSPHAITIPNHAPLRVGTLSAIVAEVARHHERTRDQLLLQLFDP
jgi:predicted RNA binding protein YcfA (HicA-like mRNA interferase family)